MKNMLIAILMTLCILMPGAFAATAAFNANVTWDGVRLNGYCMASAPINYTITWGWKWLDNGVLSSNNSFDLSVISLPAETKLISSLESPIENHTYVFECTPYSYESSLVDIALDDSFYNANYTSEGWYPALRGISEKVNSTFVEDHFNESNSALHIKQSETKLQGCTIVPRTGFTRNIGTFLPSIYSASFSVMLQNSTGEYYFYLNGQDQGFQPNGNLSDVKLAPTESNPACTFQNYADSLIKITIDPNARFEKRLGCRSILDCDDVWVQKLVFHIDGFYTGALSCTYGGECSHSILSNYVYVAGLSDYSPALLNFSFYFQNSTGDIGINIKDALVAQFDESGHYTGYVFRDKVFSKNVYNTSVWPASFTPFNYCFTGNCSDYTWTTILYSESSSSHTPRYYGEIKDAMIELSVITQATVNETGNALNATSFLFSTLPLPSPEPIHTTSFASILARLLDSRGCTAAGNFDTAPGVDYFVTEDKESKVFVFNAGSNTYAPSATAVFDSGYKYCRAVNIDYDHDGFDDILVAGLKNSTDSATIDIWRNNKQGGFTLAYSQPSASSYLFNQTDDTNAWAVRDMDMNGYVDIMFRAINSTGQEELAFLRGSYAGFIKDNTAIAGIPLDSSSDIAFNDFDDDGYPDLVYNRRVYRFYGGVFTEKVIFTQYDSNQILIADIDGEGNEEIISSSSTGGIGSRTEIIRIGPDFLGSEIGSLPYGIRTGARVMTSDIRVANAFPDAVFIGEDVVADAAHRYRKFAIEYDSVEQSFIDTDLVGIISGSGNGDAWNIDTGLLVRIPVPEFGPSNPVIIVPIPEKVIDSARLPENKPLGFVDADGNMIALVDPAHPTQGLLPEIGIGIMEFFSNMGVKTMFLIFLLIGTLFVFAIISLLVAVFEKIGGR